MTTILKSVYLTELKFGAAATRFFSHHLFLGYLTIFVGMPLFVLGAICVCSTALILPFALLFGLV